MNWEKVRILSLLAFEGIDLPIAEVEFAKNLFSAVAA